MSTMRIAVLLFAALCLQSSESALTVIPCSAINDTSPLLLTSNSPLMTFFEVRDCIPSIDSPWRSLTVANSVNVNLVLRRSFVRVEVVNSSNIGIAVYDLDWSGGRLSGIANAFITVQDSKVVSPFTLHSINVTLVDVAWSNTPSRLIDMSPTLSAHHSSSSPSDVVSMRAIWIRLSNVTVNITSSAALVNTIVSLPSIVSEMLVVIEGCRWDAIVQDMSDWQHALVAFTQVYDARHVAIHIADSNFSTLSVFINESSKEPNPMVPIAVIAIQDAIDQSTRGSDVPIVLLPCEDITITVFRCVAVMGHLYGMRVGSSFLQLRTMNYTSRLQPKNVSMKVSHSHFDLVGHDHAHVVGVWAVNMTGLSVEVSDCDIIVRSKGPAWNEQIFRSAGVVRLDGSSTVNDSIVVVTKSVVRTSSQAGADLPFAMDGCSGPVATVIVAGQMWNTSLVLTDTNVFMALDFGYASTFITRTGGVASPFFSATVAAILLDDGRPASAVDSTFRVAGCNISYSLSFAASLSVIRPYCFLLATGMLVSTISLIHTRSIIRNNTVLILPLLHPIDRPPTTLLSLYDTALWANAAAPRGAAIKIVNNSVLVENVTVLDSNESFASMMHAIPAESRGTVQQRTSFNIVGLTGTHVNTTVVVRGLRRRRHSNVSDALEFTAVGMRGIAGITNSSAGEGAQSLLEPLLKSGLATQLINSSLLLENVTIGCGFAVAWRDTAVVDSNANLSLVMSGCHLTAPATNATGPLSVFRLIPVLGTNITAPIPTFFATITQSTFSGFTDIFQNTSVGWSADGGGVSNFRVTLGCNEFDSKPLLAREIGAPDQFILQDPQVVDGAVVDGIACEDPFRRKLPAAGMSKGRMAAGAAVAIVGLGSVTFSNCAAGAVAQRGMLLTSLSLCPLHLDEDESPPPLSDSLLQLSIGASPNAYDRGTLVGNMAVIGVLCMRLLLVGYVAVVAAGTLSKLQRQRDEGCCAALFFLIVADGGLPGNMISALLLLLQPCVTAATSIASSLTAAALESVMYWILCLVVAVAPSVVMAMWSAHRVGLLIPLPTKHSLGGGAKQINGASPGVVGGAGSALHRLEASLRWLTASSMRWEASSSSSSKLFLKHFGGVVSGYRSDRVWFAIVEVAVAIAFGIVGGIHPQSEKGCLALQGVNTGLCITALLAAVALTPSSTRLGNASMVGMGALNTVGSICLLTGDDASAEMIGLTTAWVGVAVFALEVVSECYFVGWRRALMDRFIRMKFRGGTGDNKKPTQLWLPLNKKNPLRRGEGSSAHQLLDAIIASANSNTHRRGMTDGERIANLKVLIELVAEKTSQ